MPPSTPGWKFGYVPSAGEWNNTFGKKADYPVPIDQAGTGATTAEGANYNLQQRAEIITPTAKLAPLTFYGVRTDLTATNCVLPAAATCLAGDWIELIDAGDNAAANYITISAANGDNILSEASSVTTYLIQTSGARVILVTDGVGSWRVNVGAGTGGGGSVTPPIPRQIDGTAYTLQLSDAGQYLQFTSADPVTITVPKNSTVSFALGIVVILEQFGAGELTIAPASGVTLNGHNELQSGGQFAVMQLKNGSNASADTWTLLGDGIPLGGGETIPDAPTDGKYYGRESGTWAPVTEEAPKDNNAYARKNGTWVEASGAISVSDGTTTVNPATEIVFSGATVSQGSAGVAEVTISGGGGGGGGGAGVLAYAFATVDGSGNVTLAANENVASITRSAVGQYHATFTNPVTYPYLPNFGAKYPAGNGNNDTPQIGLNRATSHTEFDANGFDFVVQTSDGQSLVDPAILWFEIPNVAASGGGETTAPTIVQAVYARGAGQTLTLPNAPTVGNMLVALYASQGGSPPSPPAGFTTIGFSANGSTLYGSGLPGTGSTYQGGYAAVKEVSDTTAGFAFPSNGSDPHNFALLEITPANCFDFDALGMNDRGGGVVYGPFLKPAYPALHLCFFEHDVAGALSVSQAGLTTLNAFNGSQGNGNHAAVLAMAVDTFTGEIQANYAGGSTNYPVLYRTSLAKR